MLPLGKNVADRFFGDFLGVFQGFSGDLFGKLLGKLLGKLTRKVEIVHDLSRYFSREGEARL